MEIIANAPESNIYNRPTADCTWTALIGTYEIFPPIFFCVLTSPVVKMRRQFPLSVRRSNLGCSLSLPSSGFLLPPDVSISLRILVVFTHHAAGVGRVSVFVCVPARVMFLRFHVITNPHPRGAAISCYGGERVKVTSGSATTTGARQFWSPTHGERTLAE